MSLPDNDNRTKGAMDLTFLDAAVKSATAGAIQETDNLKSILTEFVDSFDVMSEQPPQVIAQALAPETVAEPFDVLLDRLEELNKYIDDILS